MLGFITAVGPFAIDMYLPALPSIGGVLHASPASVQMSLMVFFITLGACQLVYGPLSDMFGRKMPIYVGLAIFTVGCVGCAFAPDVNVLIGFRVLQALGACAGMVLMGALQFVVGAAVMAVSGLFADGAPKPMVIGIAISAVVAFAIARFTLPAENGHLPAEADCPG